MPALKDMTVPPKHILVYGESKSGKTLTVGKLAEKLNLIWLDGEAGWETLRQLPDEWQERIELLSIPDDPSNPMFAETVGKIVTGGPCWVDHETGKVNHPFREKNDRPSTLVEMRKADKNTVLVIDSSSAVDASIRNQISKGKPADYKFDWDDWGNLGNILTKIFTYVQNSQFHVVVIGHDGIVTQDDKTEIIGPQAGTRNFSKNFGKFFGDLVYTDVENKRYKIASSAQYSNKIRAGSRANVALEKSAEPRLLDLFGL